MGFIIRLAVLAAVLTATNSAATDLTGIVSVEECLRIALQNRPELAAAGARIEAAGQRVRRARSRFMPQIGASYSFTRQKQTLSSLVGGPSGGSTNLGICQGGPRPGSLCSRDSNCGTGGSCFIRVVDVQTNQSSEFNFHRGTFALDQLVFDFGKVMNQSREASALQDSVEAERVATEQLVVLDVKAAYYTLIAASRLVTVAEDTEAQTRRQLEESRSRYEVGSAPRFDVTQQEVQVANAELARLTARNQVALGRENLRNSMGLSEPIHFDPNDDTLDYRTVRVHEEEAVDEAFARRPELRTVAALKQAQRQQIMGLRKDYLPLVGGTANYNWTGSDAPEDESWLIGANLTLLIFDGGRTGAQVGESRAELLRLEADERIARQRVVLEVRQSILDLRVAEQSIRVAAKAVDQGSESLAIAEGRYSAGVGNILEVSDAQVGLARARADHVQSLADYWVSVAQLEHAVGAPLQVLD
jgi:outer membrane protein